MGADARTGHGCAGSGLGQSEALVGPPSDAAEHELHRTSEACEPQGGLVGPVAVRAGAVDDEQRQHRLCGHTALGDLAMGQVDRARHVASGEERGAAHVEEDEVRRAGRDRFIRGPTVSLKGEFCRETGDRVSAGRGGRLGHGARHLALRSASRCAEHVVDASPLELARTSNGVKIMPNVSTHGPCGPLVCVLAYDGLCRFEFGVAAEVFALPPPRWGRAGIAVPSAG